MARAKRERLVDLEEKEESKRRERPRASSFSALIPSQEGKNGTDRKRVNGELQKFREQHRAKPNKLGALGARVPGGFNLTNISVWEK